MIMVAVGTRRERRGRTVRRPPARPDRHVACRQRGGPGVPRIGGGHLGPPLNPPNTASYLSPSAIDSMHKVCSTKCQLQSALSLSLSLSSETLCSFIWHYSILGGFGSEGREPSNGSFGEADGGRDRAQPVEIEQPEEFLTCLATRLYLRVEKNMFKRRPGYHVKNQSGSLQKDGRNITVYQMNITCKLCWL